jgi:hypothetical protein
MAGVVEEIVKHKEEIIVKVLNVLEGKEASASVNLDGIKFTVGKNVEIRLNGSVDFTVTPLKKKK